MGARNFYGPSSFCRNPHAGSGNSPLRSVLAGWPDAESTAAIRAGLPQLWEPYVAVSTRWEPRALLDRLDPLLGAIGDDAQVAVGLVSRIEEAFASRARELQDLFRELEVRALCAAALLPRSDHPVVELRLVAACETIADMAMTAIGGVVAGLQTYQFALVHGGLSELYELPIRLSKLLGWAGFTVHACRIIGRDGAAAAQRMRELYAKIYDTYSFVARSTSVVRHLTSSRRSLPPRTRIFARKESSCSVICILPPCNVEAMWLWEISIHPRSSPISLHAAAPIPRRALNSSRNQPSW